MSPFLAVGDDADMVYTSLLTCYFNSVLFLPNSKLTKISITFGYKCQCLRITRRHTSIGIDFTTAVYCCKESNEKKKIVFITNQSKYDRINTPTWKIEIFLSLEFIFRSLASKEILFFLRQFGVHAVDNIYAQN